MWGSVYLVNDLMTFAEMWRKKMEAMNASERTTTTNGSLRRAQPNPTRMRVSG